MPFRCRYSGGLNPAPCAPYSPPETAVPPVQDNYPGGNLPLCQEQPIHYRPIAPESPLPAYGYAPLPGYRPMPGYAPAPGFTPPTGYAGPHRSYQVPLPTPKMLPPGVLPYMTYGPALGPIPTIGTSQWAPCTIVGRSVFDEKAGRHFNLIQPPIVPAPAPSNISTERRPNLYSRYLSGGSGGNVGYV
ncbi:hypothetical protein NP493_378g01023 [Ridgeia piscesae]|uniref:Uncharacterized protein n=1 Tax=Ridgeia piscesae TaxID=27915 RepID=A0AAD9L1X3_RIDPI|nr:hypothetical protein NP493_378g01023 [Ridgeia piscesae]